MNRDHTAPFQKKGPKAARMAERDLRGALEREMETKFLAPLRQHGIQAGKEAQGIFARSPRAKEIKRAEKDR